VLVGGDRSLDLDSGRIDLVDDLDHDDRVESWRHRVSGINPHSLLAYPKA
jgi:hypothetical protein